MLIFCAAAIFVRQDISHPESMVQWAVKEVASSDPLYPDFRVWPHRLMPYGPLLCYPAGLIYRLAGLDGFGFHIYLFGRLQSFAYLIGIIAVCGFILSAAGARRSFTYAYSAAYLALWSGIIIPTASFRADLPGLFWTLLAAFLAFRGAGNTKAAYLALIPVLVSAAYKPAFWAFPAAFCLFLWKRESFKSGFSWGLSLLASFFAYVLIAQLLTDNLFILNQVGGSSLGLTLQVYEIARDLLLNQPDHPVLPWDLCLRLFIAVGAAVWVLRYHPLPLAQGISLYYLLAVPVNLLTLFKVGAALNYLLEAYVISGLVLALAGHLVYGQFHGMRRVMRFWWIMLTVAVFGLPLVYFTIKNVEGAITTYKNRETPAHLVKLMNLPGTALLGDSAFTHPSEDAHALSDPVPYAQLSVKGVIPKEPLTRRLEAREFSHFVMSPGMKYLFFAPDKAKWVGDILQENYAPTSVEPEYEIWVPKASNGSPTTGTLQAPVPTE